MPSSPFAAQLTAFAGQIADLTPWVDPDYSYREVEPGTALDEAQVAENRLFQIVDTDAPPLTLPNEPELDTRGASRAFTLKIRYDGHLNLPELRTRMAHDDDQLVGVLQSSDSRVAGVRSVTCTGGTREQTNGSATFVIRSLEFEVFYTATVSA